MEKTESISWTTLVHRIGGGGVDNFRLKPSEESLNPPGISVFLGGTALEAAEQIRQVFPHATRLLDAAQTVGSTTVGEIRRTGFDVMPDRTRHFVNHARLIHAEGVAGFSVENLERLARVFEDTSGISHAS